LIAAGYSACHGRERDHGNPAHAPPSTHCTNRRYHVVILVLIAAGIYVITFVILSPMIG
jgi:hypothetical protein